MSTPGGRAPRPAGVYDYAPKHVREQWSREAADESAGADRGDDPDEAAYDDPPPAEARRNTGPRSSPLVPTGPHEDADNPPEEADDNHARTWDDQDPEEEPPESEDEFGDEWQEEMAYRTELRERHARAAEFDREYDRKLEQLADSLRTLRSEEDPDEAQHAPARGARATREQYSPEDLDRDRDVYIEGVRLPRFLQASYVPPAEREGGYHLRAILAVAIACVIAAPFVYYFTSGNPFAPSRDKLAQPALQYTVASTSATLPPLDPPAVHDLQPASNAAPYAPVAAAP